MLVRKIVILTLFLALFPSGSSLTANFSQKEIQSIFTGHFIIQTHIKNYFEPVIEELFEADDSSDSYLLSKTFVSDCEYESSKIKIDRFVFVQKSRKLVQYLRGPPVQLS